MIDSVNASIYDFTVETISHELVSLKDYSGKVLLIVNTASECGYTPQYEGLQYLHENYKDQGLVVMGFPANNFGSQEPGNNQQIDNFCRLNFGVQFPMFSKVSVNGSDQHPLFAFLTQEQNGSFTGDINWNFEKFLISRSGNLTHRFRSGTDPVSEEILSVIEESLGK